MDARVAAPPPVSARKGWLKLTPINQRRLDNFRSNQRGYWSLWLFGVMFFVSLFAEVIANDRPILVSYRGEILSPMLFDYPEEKFGGFLAHTDYRADVIAREIKSHGWILWPPLHFSYSTQNLEVPTAAPSAPTWTLSDAQCRPAAEKAGGNVPPGQACKHIEWNWLGTDVEARDVLARVIYGFRISVLFGLTLGFFSSAVGIAAGAVQGYFGGWIDLIFQRFIEIWSSLPQLLILIIFASIFTPGVGGLLLILLLFSWVSLVHLVRAEFLRARNLEYVNAARALGLSNISIMYKHILPNAMVSTLTFMPFILSGSIETLTSLDYLGFGLPPGSPSLGELLLEGKSNLSAPWLALTGFFIISIMLSLLVFIGEAVRDAFDPRKTFA